MDIGFVVLHYKTFDMTKECIDSLLDTFNNIESKIVIVDNGSANGSGEKLKEAYFESETIDVLLNPDNLGFANGNNIGYKHLVRNYHPRYIVVMNNDVIIKDKQFVEKINRIYKDTEFAVLGPDIINPLLKNHQNPERIEQRSLQEVENRIRSFERKTHLPHVFFVLSKIKCIFRNEIKNNINTNYNNQRENVVLHGACYIFSEEYIKRRECCFNPNTFLYHEEDILYAECKSLGLKMVYSPLISVEHYEDVATNASFSNEYRRMKMRNIWLRDSAKELLKVMKK